MKTPKTLVAAIAAMASTAIMPLAAFATTYTWNGGASGNLSTAANWSPAPGGAFTASDELVIDSPAKITVDSATTVSKITVTAQKNVSFLSSGGAGLTVTRIANTGTGVTRFFCPVQFSGTLYVEQNGPVQFPGGATATYPDPALRTASSSDLARTLDGIFTFTANWNVSRIGDGSHPWRIAPGSEVRGQEFTGSESGNNRILYLPEDAYACFTKVTIGNERGEIGIDGFLEATTEIIIGGGAGSHTLGTGGTTGRVKAPYIHKTTGNYFYMNTPNIDVGAGGIGMTYRNYQNTFSCDTTITATDSFEFLGLYNNSTTDWAINLNGKTITINVPAGITVTCGVNVCGSGKIVKTGAGMLVMSNTFNGETRYTKTYTGGTVVEEGTIRIVANNQIGTGPITVKRNGRLEVASGVAISNGITGDGSLYLENGTSLAISSAMPSLMSEVALASGANVTITATDTPSAPAVLLTGVSAADYSRFTLPSGFAFNGGAAVMTAAAAATDYVWTGANGADWATPGNWLVNGATPAAAPGSGSAIRFENTAPVTVGGSGTLTVTKIVTTSGAAVTFNCPVAFNGTYLVENAATAPVFAGGATATIPDASLTNMNVPSHILPDGLTLTQNWTIPLQPANNPFVVPAGATIAGKALSAETYNASQPALRVDEGAVATFDSIAIARRFVFWLNGGRLVATGDVTLGSETGGGGDFGYYAQINDGLIEANGIYKSASGGGTITCYLTNFVVGASGFGMLYHDYNFNLQRSATLTAKADTTIHQPIGKENEGDWGLELVNNSVFTVDTVGHRVVFDSLTRNTGGRLVKVGAGELVMQSRAKLHTGGTDVKAGKMTVNLSNGTGRGLTTVESGATLSFTSVATSHAYPITVKSGATLEWAAAVNMSAALTLEAGVTLKPAQNGAFDAAGGRLVLPASGTLTIDMSGLTFTDGVAVPILGGVAAGDEDTFTVILPQDVVGTLSVSSGGVLNFTSGSASDLFWNANAGLTEWSTSAVAWTNETGMATAFMPYANAVIAGATAITIPADVVVNDVKVSADADMTLSGAGKLGGAGLFTKTGDGTLDFNATGGLDQQVLVISNGVFRVGDDLKDHALGGTGDSTPIVVAAGATLDANYNQTGKTEAERTRVLHDKLIHIAGDGVDGRGAIVNDSASCHNLLTALVLDDDASLGGTKRFDIRRGSSASDYARTATSIYGPGKTLTVKNTSVFGIIGADITLGALRIASGSTVQFQYEGAINIANGIHIDGGTLYFEYGSNIGNTSVTADSGNCTIRSAYNMGTISGPVTVAPGATLTHTSGDVTYNGAVNGLVVSGGNARFNGAANDVVVTSGTAYHNWGDGTSIRFIQNGSTFDYGGAGFSATGGDVNDNGNGTVLFNGGTFNASADWSITHYIPLFFKDDWALNQANGTTVTWQTALDGDGDVTLNGAATLVGDKEVQGAVGGKWAVGAGFTAGLEGAASLLGGLDLGVGASASVNIATNRSAVFTARDFGDRDLNNANSLAGRFNKKMGSSTRGTITHDETFLFTHYADVNRPFGNMNLSAAYAVGQFYVERGAAGMWSFSGKCDDRVGLWIDGELVMMSTSDCGTVTGEMQLDEGWHSFRHIITDNSGGFGADSGNAYQTIGYKDGSGTMSAFARFNVKNLKMRPAADMGDANNANTVRWRHYKGSASDVTADTFKRDDFVWDFCCITNTLDMIQWKGDTSTYMNGYTVNRYDGWFLVTEEDADKVWTFRSQYDDRCALWIDGVDSGLRGESGNTQTYGVTLSRGWHSFRIQTADFTGGAGPWDTGKFAISYQVAGDAEKQFTDANLTLSLCPDGYVQGGVTLASGATLSNTATENAAVIYGAVTATGTGATLDGAFKFEGGTLAFTNVASNVKNLSTVLAFNNPPADYLENVGAIAVDFDGRMPAKVVVCPAGGLTAKAAAEKVRVTEDGVPLEKGYLVSIVGGNITLHRPGFTVFIK